MNESFAHHEGEARVAVFVLAHGETAKQLRGDDEKAKKKIARMRKKCQLR